MRSPTFKLVLFTREDRNTGKRWWIAQCLDYDIAAQAEKIDDAQYRLMQLIAGRMAMAQKKGIEPFRGLEPAPARYWQLFEETSAQVSTPDTRTYPSMPSVLARVA